MNLPSREDVEFMEKAILSKYLTLEVNDLYTAIKKNDILVLDTLAHTTIDCLQYNKYKLYLKMDMIFTCLLRLKDTKEVPHFSLQMDDWYAIVHPVAERAREEAVQAREQKLDTEPDIEPTCCFCF